LAAAMSGKQKGDEIMVNGKTMVIKAVEWALSFRNWRIWILERHNTWRELNKIDVNFSSIRAYQPYNLVLLSFLDERK
jgi:hypothetical protein